MVERADRELVCEFCGTAFVYTCAEQEADEAAAYPPPRGCPLCVRERHAAAAARRAARAPRKRRYRR